MIHTFFAVVVALYLGANTPKSVFKDVVKLKDDVVSLFENDKSAVGEVTDNDACLSEHEGEE